LIFAKNITWIGSIIAMQEAKVGNFDFYGEVPKLVKDGKLKLKLDERNGLESGPQLFVDMLKGDTTGKPVIKVADP
jgi:NADPH-dependent curcumin reductase CurA